MIEEEFDFISKPIKNIGSYLVTEGIETKPTICIYGFPFDEGTRINNGRVGSEKGPQEFRKTLYESEFENSEFLSQINFMDAGEVKHPLDFPLSEAHEILQYNIEKLLKIPNCLPFVVGGSNDQSFPNATALINAFPQDKIGVINIDAHFDVRPLVNGKAHSGSPFRQLIQSEAFQNKRVTFVEFASQGAQCSNHHFNFLKHHGCKVYFLEKDIRKSILHSNESTQAGALFSKILAEDFSSCNKIFVSFDVDSINSAFMPGVSAPSVIGGLTFEEALDICRISGCNEKVQLFDISEFNPTVEKIKSSKLLARMFFELAQTFSKRKFISY